MKKKILSILLCGILVLFFGGCGQNYQEAIDNNSTKEYGGGYFTVITEWRGDGGENCYIVYANDTKVKYLIWSSFYRFSITPLYNADSTLQIYGEE